MWDSESVVIVGGGGMGLQLADALARRNIPCVVVDKNPVASYSSTRNQGWLQSGAYYASIGDTEAAWACKRGAERILDDAPEAVHTDVPSYFLFEREAERDAAVDACRQFDIACDPLTKELFEEVREANPLLAGSRLLHACRTTDAPVDTHILLRRIAARAAANGAQFRSVQCMHVVSVSRVEGGWRVSLGEGNYVESRVVVVAAGPYMPQLLQASLPDFLSDLTVTKVPVLSVSSSGAPVSSAMIVTPGIPYGPNIVPYRSSEGVGVTVCLAGADEDCDERGALDEDQPSHSLRDFASITDVFPGFVPRSDGTELHGQLYMCQKLKSISGKRERILHHEDGADGSLLMAVYPGKFSATPVVAEECFAYIADRRLESTIALSPSEPPEVARQRYFDEPQYRITADEGRLAFEVP